MSDTISTEADPTTNRATNGRFTKDNRGGPGNPFARQTAALRAYLLNHVTERDLQDILDILLLNAKGGHLPSIKFLFSYVLGKPKPVVEPDLLDLQEMQLMQQGALPSEELEKLCDQLPLDLQVPLTRFSQTENGVAAVQTALDNEPAAALAPPTAPPSGPSTNGEPCSPAAVLGPSTDGDFGASEDAEQKKSPSTNGKIQRPPRPAKMAGFNWLGDLRRAFGGRAMT